jgi:uncharacterized protein (TIGR02145 family)
MGSPTKNICPTGWHVPSDTEWDILTSNLGNDLGGKMKSMGTTYWSSQSAGTDNSSGFSGLPGGFRNGRAGDFNNKGNHSYFWSSTASGSNAWLRTLNHDNDRLDRSDWFKKDGVSVRCLKD